MRLIAHPATWFAGLVAAAATLTVVAAKLPGPSAQEIELMQRDQYCQNVAQWNAEAARGVAPAHRYGHPDYDGIADDECSLVLSPVDGTAYASN
ncbi:hypothetical protein [Salinicola aestuarinus]|uniref:hypothetical protein n=1 Tax=Salinicola aestuarinus TaxID=1949082 RepID=UPI000DA1CAEE|nr:hypothetical protein [Salinicola aestuarinus]